MKKPKRRLLACLLAVMLCTAVFSTTAYADGGNYHEYEIPPEENAVPPGETTTPEPTATPGVLTPEGNLTLVDDITGTAAGEKEFITVVTKNEHYFYIVIDRSAKGSNTVHFLNKVDEADLLALLSEEEIETYQQEKPTPTPQPTAAPTQEATPTPTTSHSRQLDETAIRGAVILVLCAVLGILVFFFMLSKKNASGKTKGGSDLSEYDFGEDEDEEDDYAARFEKYDPESEEDD